MIEMTLANFLYTLRDSDQGKELLKGENFYFFRYCLEHIRDSKSQNFQDLWVLYEYNRICNGAYTKGNCVEFGAADGFNGSNTYLLESYNWSRLLSEPNPQWHEELFHNVDTGIVSKKCIHWESGKKIPFVSVSKDKQLSTIRDFMNSDYNSKIRHSQINSEFMVETITLYDFLNLYEWYKEIDYISVDTEGTELLILEKFFQENDGYKVKMFTIEHNYNPEVRENIYKLMTENNYERKFTEFSRWDEFFLHKDYIR